MNVLDDSNLITHMHTLYTHVDTLAQAHTEADLSTPFIFNVYKAMANSNNMSGYYHVTVLEYALGDICVCARCEWHVKIEACKCVGVICSVWSEHPCLTLIPRLLIVTRCRVFVRTSSLDGASVCCDVVNNQGMSRHRVCVSLCNQSELSRHKMSSSTLLYTVFTLLSLHADLKMCL